MLFYILLCSKAVVLVAGLALVRLLNRTADYISDTLVPSVRESARAIGDAVQDDPPEYRPVMVRHMDNIMKELTCSSSGCVVCNAYFQLTQNGRNRVVLSFSDVLWELGSSAWH